MRFGGGRADVEAWPFAERLSVSTKLASRPHPANNTPVELLSAADSLTIEQHLHRLLTRVLHADGLSQLNEMIRQYVLAGGKRVRPQLCVWTYERVSGLGFRVSDELHFRTLTPETRAPLLDLACGWELFHAFLLIHDDIIDSAELRRDQAALHKQLASLDSNCPRFGMNLGIVAGDLLFSAAMRVWHDLDLPGDIYRDELRLFSRIATITGFGQAIDICQSHVPMDEVCHETLLREYHWKTAAYTFEGPMLSGAILAGASKEAQDAISRFALALGQAYQMQNDLLDLLGPLHEGCDIAQGKRTPTLLQARLEMSEDVRKQFDEDLQLATLAPTPERMQSLRDRVLTTGAAEKTTEYIDELLVDAHKASEDASLNDELRIGMKQLLEKLQAKYFVRA
jgi:geranylgeranyl diphosphate synthase type I